MHNLRAFKNHSIAHCKEITFYANKKVLFTAMAPATDPPIATPPQGWGKATRNPRSAN